MNFSKKNHEHNKINRFIVSKILKTTVLTLFFGLSMITIQAQVTKPNLKKPKLKPRVTTKPYKLLTPFEELTKDLNQGKCFEIVQTSLQLNARNQAHSAFHEETRHGKGFLEKNGKELKAVFSLQIGLKQTRYQGTLQTTVRIKKEGKGVVIDIRNSQYFHLLRNVKIVKKKNGYYITTERNDNNMTVSFTFAIYKTACLI